MLSGRAVRNKKLTVEEVRKVDIGLLMRDGLFRDGENGIWRYSWSRGGKTRGSIGYMLVEAGGAPVGIRFLYMVSDNGSGEYRNFDYVVALESTACHYGGVRWWFVCPLVRDGRRCERRCGILYLPPRADFLGCRECYGLSYESRQRHRESYYEEVVRPDRKVKRVSEKLKRVRSEKWRVQLMDEFERAELELLAGELKLLKGISRDLLRMF